MGGPWTLSLIFLTLAELPFSATVEDVYRNDNMFYTRNTSSYEDMKRTMQSTMLYTEGKSLFGVSVYLEILSNNIKMYVLMYLRMTFFILIFVQITSKFMF